MYDEVSIHRHKGPGLPVPSKENKQRTVMESCVCVCVCIPVTFVIKDSSEWYQRQSDL